MPQTPKIVAPFTDEQVAALNDYQIQEFFHPFTCPNEMHKKRPILVATNNGWVCSDSHCTYTQDWAHGYMAEPVASPLADNS